MTATVVSVTTHQAIWARTSDHLKAWSTVRESARDPMRSGYYGGHGGTSALRGHHLDCPSDRVQTVAHVGQPHAGGRTRPSGVEARAVVGDREPPSLRVLRHAQRHRAGAGVLGGVLNLLHATEVQHGLDGCWKACHDGGVND